MTATICTHAMSGGGQGVHASLTHDFDEERPGTFSPPMTKGFLMNLSRKLESHVI